MSRTFVARLERIEFTALHIALWSQIGVLCRVYLAAFLGNRCSGGGGACVISKGITSNSYGLLYPDLGANILGSFFMGFVISDTTPRAVMLLPQDHTWQSLTDVHIGVRTGFCGSFTTFASWQLSLLQLLIGGAGYQGGQWDQYLVGQFGTGLLCSLGSYMLGLKAAELCKALFEKKSNSAFNVEAKPKDTSSHLKHDGATIALLALLTSLWIVLACLDDMPKHAARRQQWFALLFAPFGACLRWQITRVNGKLPNLDWLPVGTMSANLLACSIDFALQAVINRLHHPSYWLTVLFGAARIGFSGSLSTVSTFIQEVYKLGKPTPLPLRSSVYAVGSMALANLLGVIIYGWSVWI